jgi:Uma2 family endonuclease
LIRQAIGIKVLFGQRRRKVRGIGCIPYTARIEKNISQEIQEMMTGTALQTKSNRYTVADYMAWPDHLRCELIEGVIYDMSPAPVIEHQRLSGALSFLLRRLLQEFKSGGGCGDCEVFSAPIDVVLAFNTVVQPDVIVVCNPAKLANGKYVDGAPDLVVEILSPSTALKDKREKLRLYERSGVAEYLIVDAHEFYAEIYRLDACGRYALPELLGSRDVLKLTLFPELGQTLGELFGWPDNDLNLAVKKI